MAITQTDGVLVFSDTAGQQTHAYAITPAGLLGPVGQPGIQPKSFEGDPLEFARRFWSSWTIEYSAARPGEYHPRIWRNSSDAEAHRPVERSSDYPAFLASLNQLESLWTYLDQIFLIVSPSSSALDTVHGIRIRELLMLACMEFESSCRSIMTANGYQFTGRPNTNQYVLLLDRLHLAGYSLRLPRHPDVLPIAPFAHWTPSAPTTSLSWYSAYNATKHDREQNLSQATLGAAICALAAAEILVHAQFGPEAIRRHSPRSPFIAVALPRIPLSQLCHPPLEGSEFTAIQLWGRGDQA